MKLKACAAAVFLATVFFPLSASAAATMCWFGECFFFENQSCSRLRVILAGENWDNGICFTGGALTVNPNTDYIEVVGGSAFLVQRGTRTPFASAETTASLNALDTKFPLAKRQDPKVREAFKQAQDLFVRQAKGGPVSPTTVSSAARTLGLKVRRN